MAVLLLPALPRYAIAADSASPPIVEVFDEGLPSGAKWEAISEKMPVRPDGGFAGQRWAYVSSRDAQISVSGLSLKVREKPEPGEVRYISFAYRKWGGGQVALQVDRDAGADGERKAGQAYGFRYDVGQGAPVSGQALRVADQVSERWTQITRDLWQDFGDITITGFTFVSVGGRDAGLDRLYLAPSMADFKAMLPTDAELALNESRFAPAEEVIPAQASPVAGSMTTSPTGGMSTSSSIAAQTQTPSAVAEPVGGVATFADAPETSTKTHAFSWAEKLKQSGEVGVIQLLLSIFGAVFIFERLFNLRQKHLVPAGLTSHARRLWTARDYAALERLKDTHPSTLGRVISFVAENRHLPLSEVSAIAGELVTRDLDVHYRKAYPLGVVATIAPLLGLLGMILGMIETFEIVSAAGSLGDPTQLASGIAEALVTTGLGIAIAIPFLGFYHWFKHRTSGFGVQLEEQVTSLLTAWFLRRRPMQAGVDDGNNRDGNEGEPSRKAEEVCV